MKIKDMELRLQKLRYYYSCPQFEKNDNTFDKSTGKPQIAEFHKTAVDAKLVKKQMVGLTEQEQHEQIMDRNQVRWIGGSEIVQRIMDSPLEG